MAETSGFFQSVNGDRKYGSAFLAAREAALVTNGIHNNELGVTPGGEMTLTLAVGRAWINGYFYLNDLAKTLTVETANGALPRIDSVVLRWSLDERTIIAKVITGTPSDAPAAPALVRDAGTYDLKLCEVRIPAGTTELTLDMITDTRLDGEVCGIVSGTLSEIDYAEYYKYMQAQFDTFMDSLENSLSGDVAGNLQLQINDLEDKSIVTLTHEKSGTVHQLSGLGGRLGLVSAQFKAAGDYAKGDTFAVDGENYSAALPDGKDLIDGMFVSGAIVAVILDTEGKTVNFKGGGLGYTIDDVIPLAAVETVWTESADYDYLPYDSEYETAANDIRDFNYQLIELDYGGLHNVDRINEMTCLKGVRDKFGNLAIPGTDTTFGDSVLVTPDCKGNWYALNGSSVTLNSAETVKTSTVKLTKYNSSGQAVWTKSASLTSSNTSGTGLLMTVIMASEKQNRVMAWQISSQQSKIFIFDTDTGTCVFKEDYGRYGTGDLIDTCYTVTYDYDNDVVVMVDDRVVTVSFAGEIVSTVTCTGSTTYLPIRSGHYYNGAIYGCANGENRLLKVDIATGAVTSINTIATDSGFINNDGCIFFQNTSLDIVAYDLNTKKTVATYAMDDYVTYVFPMGNGKKAIALVGSYDMDLSYIAQPNRERIGYRVKEVIK